MKRIGWGFGIPHGETKWGFRSWATHIWLWIGWMANGTSTIKDSERWCERRRTWWTRLTWDLWEIIWKCSSTSTEIGIKKLIVSHMWQEKKGTTWNSNLMEEGTRVKAVRSFFDGGVNVRCDDKIKHKVVSAFMIQIAERIEDSPQKMKWKTIVEVAKVLPDDATITLAECTAAVEAARAICCLARTGSVCFDLDANLIEDWSGNKTRIRNGMKEDQEGRWKRKQNKKRSLQGSHICYRHLFLQAFRIRALLKRWRVRSTPNSVRNPVECSCWLAKYEWWWIFCDSYSTVERQITLADHHEKTVEGLMSEKPCRGVKLKIRRSLWRSVKETCHEVCKLNVRKWRRLSG